MGRSWYAAHFCNLNLTFISYSFWNIRRKVLKFYKFDEKRAITPRWVSDLLQNCRVYRSWCADHFYPCQIFDIINSFWVITKNITICFIFSNSGHVGWCTASPDTILKLDTLVMIQTKFGFHWSSTFRGEDFWKSLRPTTDDDDGRQVMAIAHLTLWFRWANKTKPTKSTKTKRNRKWKKK